MAPYTNNATTNSGPDIRTNHSLVNAMGVHSTATFRGGPHPARCGLPHRAFPDRRSRDLSSTQLTDARHDLPDLSVLRLEVMLDGKYEPR